MGGFAAALGGLGSAAQQYGSQVRGFLEQRRDSLAQLLIQQANQERDPQHRADLLGHASDLWSLKPMEKVVPAAMKTLMDRAQGDMQLSQLAGGPPPPATVEPGQAGPGQQPGTVGGQKIPQSAAMPSGNPLAPQQGSPADTFLAAAQPATPDRGAGDQGFAQMLQAQGQPQQTQVAPSAPPPQPSAAAAYAPGMPGAPYSGAAGGGIGAAGGGIADLFQQDPYESFLSRMNQDLTTMTPAHWAQVMGMYQAGAQRAAELSNIVTETKWKQAALPELLNEYQRMLTDPSTPELFKPEIHAAIAHAKYAAVTPGEHIQMLPMMGMSRLIGSHVETYDVTNWTPEQKRRWNLPETAKGPQQFHVDGMGNIIEWVGGKFVTPEVAPTTGGGVGSFNKLTGEKIADLKDAIPASQAGVAEVPMAGGQLGAEIKADLLKGKGPTPVPGGVAPSTAATATQHMITSGNQQFPVTLTSGKVAPGATGPGAIPAPGTGAGAGAGGRIPAAGSYPKYTPDQLTPQGLKNAEDIDNVLAMISSIQDEMSSSGMLKAGATEVYADYAKYAHAGGQLGESKYPWAKMSFERLRSATAALKGGGTSRAMPIVQQALDHTPNPAFNLRSLKAPDSAGQMYQKLTDMKEMLIKARGITVQDERKSGIPGGGGVLPLVRTQQEFDALAPGTQYKEEDGNTYTKPRK